jgi:hypothetical protein
VVDGSAVAEPGDGSVVDADGHPGGGLVELDWVGADELDCGGDVDAVEESDVLDSDVPGELGVPVVLVVPVVLEEAGRQVGVLLPVGEPEPDPEVDPPCWLVDAVVGEWLGAGVGCSAGGRPGFTGGAVGGAIGPGWVGSTGTVSPGTPRAYTASSERTVARYASEWL